MELFDDSLRNFTAGKVNFMVFLDEDGYKVL